VTLSSSIIDNGKQTKKRGPQNSIIIEIVKSKNQQGNQTRESCFLPGDPVNSDHLPHLVSGKKSKTKVTTHTHLAMNSAESPSTRQRDASTAADETPSASLSHQSGNPARHG
jgi:hypothetical protein